MLDQINTLSFANITQTLPDTRRCILQKARPLHNKEVTLRDRPLLKCSLVNGDTLAGRARRLWSIATLNFR